MANLRERKIRADEASKVDREKAKDQVSLEEEVDKRGHHLTGQQMGNVGADGLAPLTEQEKRNRGLKEPPKSGEAAWRGPGVDTKPSVSKPERLQEDIGIEDRPRHPGDQYSRTTRPDWPTETRPSHP